MSFLFTIEQIELVRRLRRTGITKEQVWRAYEEMDRMDAELNTTDHSLNTSPNKNIVSNMTRTTTNSQISTINNSNCHSLQSNHSSSNENLNKNSTLCLPLHKSSLQSLQTQNTTNSLTTNPIDKSNPLPSLSQTFNLSNITTNPIELSDDESIKESSITITPITSQPEVSNAVAVCEKPQLSIYYHNEEPQELIEFKKRGETVMLNEIRSFVNKYNIRQIMIAEMTKISQGYVSRFFRGEGQDMSEKSKNLIYLWYISCRNRPEILTHYCPQTIGERRGQLSEAGDLLPIRRDRFIFRREHLLVLDKYFKENPYPDASTKEMIAEECNKTVERLAKRSLKERDKVNISVVSNWFNNKRKEIKSKKIPINLNYTSSESTSISANQSLPFVTETNLYSNHSNNSVEELETRPDMHLLSDFEDHNSIDVSDDETQNSYKSSHINSYINQNNYEIKPNFVIKLEPTF
jgi:predicted XRE-type DNA-binding protein